MPQRAPRLGLVLLPARKVGEGSSGRVAASLRQGAAVLERMALGGGPQVRRRNDSARRYVVPGVLLTF